MALEITISPGNPRPIYRQVVEQIGKAIRLGHLAKGDPVPSVRALAEQLLINPNTVARAYADLVRDGLLTSRQGRGYFVDSKRVIFTAEERERRIEEAIESLISECLLLDIPVDELVRQLEKRIKTPPRHD